MLLEEKEGKEKIMGGLVESYRRVRGFLGRSDAK